MKSLSRILCVAILFSAVALALRTLYLRTLNDFHRQPSPQAEYPILRIPGRPSPQEIVSTMLSRQTGY